jgi:hypothetical protein
MSEMIEMFITTGVRTSNPKLPFSPVFKVPRQSSLVFLVEVRLREGEALGSEKGKELEN